MKDTSQKNSKGDYRVAKVGAGVRATGVFKRIEDAAHKSGIADRVRHTASSNARYR